MNYKKPLIKLMDWLLLDCKTATLLATKGLDSQLGFFENLRLKLHLANCNFCYNFDLQSKKIDEVLKITPDKLSQNCCKDLHLDTRIKDNIKSKLTDNQ